MFSKYIKYIGVMLFWGLVSCQQNEMKNISNTYVDFFKSQSPLRTSSFCVENK